MSWDLFSVMMGYQGMNLVGESGWQSSAQSSGMLLKRQFLVFGKVL